MERRYFELQEVRAEGAEGQPPTITGYAALFDSFSQDLGGFRERIERGAFGESLQRDDVRALWSHDPSMVLGRTKNGTLKLHEDAIGLRVEITPPDNSWGRDALESIRRGDVDQMSFGFNVLPDGDTWAETKQGIVRTLRKVKLFEVSPVAFPAYAGTRVQARDLFGDDVVEIPAALRGATGAADIDCDGLRAQWSHRQRQILLSGVNDTKGM